MAVRGTSKTTGARSSFAVRSRHRGAAMAPRPAVPSPTPGHGPPPDRAAVWPWEGAADPWGNVRIWLWHVNQRFGKWLRRGLCNGWEKSCAHHWSGPPVMKGIVCSASLSGFPLEQGDVCLTRRPSCQTSSTSSAFLPEVCSCGVSPCFTAAPTAAWAAAVWSQDQTPGSSVIWWTPKGHIHVKEEIAPGHVSNSTAGEADGRCLSSPVQVLKSPQKYVGSAVVG